MQSAISRRQEILDVLMRRRQDTVSNLAFEFHVSKRTIKRDICILSRDHSIETKQGHGGGIRIADGYYIDQHYLSVEQENMLRNLMDKLSPKDQETMREILSKFSKPRTSGASST